MALICIFLMVNDAEYLFTAYLSSYPSGGRGLGGHTPQCSVTTPGGDWEIICDAGGSNQGLPQARQMP